MCSFLVACRQILLLPIDAVDILKYFSTILPLQNVTASNCFENPGEIRVKEEEKSEKEAEGNGGFLKTK